MSPRFEALAELESTVWQQLSLATRDKTHAWRTPVLATIKGDMADARTVVLRGVDPSRRALTIYTDQRAGKVTQLLHKPRGTLVMWSPQLGWQLRCRVRLALEVSGLGVDSTWARLRLTPAAQDYLSPLAPGAPLAGQDVGGDSVADAELPARTAHSHFAVIDASVEAVDWLELNAEGHRRALFDEHGARWIQP